MGVTELLMEALKLGALVDWSDWEKPILRRVPSYVAARLREDPEGLRAVLHRATIFRRLALAFIQRGGGIPVLALPGVAWTGSGTCLSCGVGVEREGARCRTCLVAVNLALEALR